MILTVHIMNSSDDYHDIVSCMHEIHQNIVKYLAALHCVVRHMPSSN